MRSALRLFCWLKVNFSQNFFLGEGEKGQILKNFSRYELENNLSWLKKNHWVTTDNQGRHYLQGKSFYRTKFDLPHKNIQCVQVLPEHVADRTAWKRFVFGGIVAKAYKSLKSSTRINDRMALTALQIPESDRSGLPCLIPLSLSILMSLGISKTTAHNVRKQAALGGHIENRQQYVKYTTPQSPHGIAIKREQWLESRGDIAQSLGAGFANKVVWREGMLYVQLPNLVAPNIKLSSRQFRKK